MIIQSLESNSRCFQCPQILVPCNMKLETRVITRLI